MHACACVYACARLQSCTPNSQERLLTGIHKVVYVLFCMQTVKKSAPPPSMTGPGPRCACVCVCMCVCSSVISVVSVTCISKVRFTYRSFIRLTILGHYATFGIEAEVLGSSPQTHKNVVFAHALHFAAYPPSGLRLKSKSLYHVKTVQV